MMFGPCRQAAGALIGGFGLAALVVTAPAGQQPVAGSEPAAFRLACHGQSERSGEQVA